MCPNVGQFALLRKSTINQDRRDKCTTPRFFTISQFASEDYETAERKIHLDLSYSVADVKVKCTPVEVD